MCYFLRTVKNMMRPASFQEAGQKEVEVTLPFQVTAPAPAGGRVRRQLDSSWNGIGRL